MSKIFYLLECEEDEYIIVKSTYCKQDGNNQFLCTTVSNSIFRGTRVYEGGARHCQNHANGMKKKATMLDDSLLLPVSSQANVNLLDF
jgi:hypothetical protein